MKWVTRERPKIGASGTANPLSPIFGRGAKWIALTDVQSVRQRTNTPVWPAVTWARLAGAKDFYGHVC